MMEYNALKKPYEAPKIERSNGFVKQFLMDHFGFKIKPKTVKLNEDNTWSKLGDNKMPDCDLNGDIHYTNGDW